MTFENLKKAVGKNIKYYSDADGWKTDRDVTEADIGEALNLVYRDELAPLFINKNPQDFRVISTVNSWIATGTASAGLTGSTVTTTSNIFQNSMEGLWLYNLTQDEKSKIVTYNSASSVTVEDDDVADWSNDTLYVLGQEFSFGGDATDTYQLESISIKYTDESTYYKRMAIADKNELLRGGWEKGNSVYPFAYLTTLNVGGILTSGFGIMPQFENKVTKAIEVSRLVKPAIMTDALSPRLPVDNALIAGATKKAFEMKQEYDKSAYWEAQYQMLTRQSVARYSPVKVKFGTGIRAPRRINNFFNR